MVFRIFAVYLHYLEMIDGIRLIEIDETESTNSWLREYRGEEGGRMTVVSAEHQTAGRGQGGNTWESERGKNLLLSVKVKPVGVRAAEQYILLEAAAVALTDVLDRYTEDISIKWPNDIYRRDKKISGTLSECSLSGGMVKDCIIGIGLNVNQRIFTSDAPNPESLANIIGRETDCRRLLDEIIEAVDRRLRAVDEGRYEELKACYMNRLYRRSGFHRYHDGQGEFEAEILSVEPNGHLVLRRKNGEESVYAFKEVTFVI